MFTLQESEQSDFEVIDEGETVLAEVVRCEVRETPFWVDENDQSKGKQQEVSFRFSVVSGPHKGRTLFGRTPTTFTSHPDCKLRAWVQEILGSDNLPVGFSFDPSDLETLQVNVIVGHRPKKNADGTTSVREFVSSVKRVNVTDIDPF
jgi:hypothetical protein